MEPVSVNVDVYPYLIVFDSRLHETFIFLFPIPFKQARADHGGTFRCESRSNAPGEPVFEAYVDGELLYTFSPSAAGSPA